MASRLLPGKLVCVVFDQIFNSSNVLKTDCPGVSGQTLQPPIDVLMSLSVGKLTAAVMRRT
ncbi:MAG: hypothetical protein ACI82O_004187 [Patiriisocius sp.]|jgi:hypothetical protein